MKSSRRQSASRAATVDDLGLAVPTDPDIAVDVLFDGRRIWSVAPPGGARPASNGLLRVEWPRPLRGFLDGIVRVTLREHLSGRVLFDSEHQFGSSVDRVRIVDAAGRPLALDKIGHLERPFEATDSPARESLLDRLAEVLSIVRDECGLPAFLSFGALLGAVREGKLIGHDNDIDISYLSRHEHPLDVARESFRIQRVMRRNGFQIRRFSTADFKVAFRISDGTFHAIDIFGGFMCEDLLHVMPRLRVPLQRADIVPLSQVKLEERTFPAPADPARFLTSAYGENWRVPDPTWRPQADRAVRRRFDGWTRGLRTHRDPWEGFYGAAPDAAPIEPSAFARWVAHREPEPALVVDVGSGDGRDALWFAGAGHRVMGLDYAYAAVACGKAAARGNSLPVTFKFFNLYELRQVLAMGAQLALADEPVVLYGRLVLDALEDRGRDNFWRLARMALRSGGRLYLEFCTRPANDGARSRGRPFLRPLNLDLVTGEIQSRGGTVECCEEGAELEPFFDRESRGTRLIARW